jgi:hypothetical protein
MRFSAEPRLTLQGEAWTDPLPPQVFERWRAARRALEAAGFRAACAAVSDHASWYRQHLLILVDEARRESAAVSVLEVRGRGRFLPPWVELNTRFADGTRVRTHDAPAPLWATGEVAGLAGLVDVPTLVAAHRRRCEGRGERVAPPADEAARLAALGEEYRAGIDAAQAEGVVRRRGDRLGLTWRGAVTFLVRGLGAGRRRRRRDGRALLARLGLAPVSGAGASAPPRG